MTTTIVRRIALPLVATCALLLGLAPVAGAAPYRVDYGPALGTGWSTLQAPGFSVGGNVVATTGQPIAAGNFAARVFTLPSDDLVIRGGTVDVSHTTGQGTMAVVNIVESIGATSMYRGSGTGTKSVAIPASTAQSLQVGLLANSPVSGNPASTVSITSASLLVNDRTPPSLTPSNVPSPLQWYPAATCIPTSFYVVDTDSGVMSTRLRAVSGDTTLHDWAATPVVGPRPGAASRSATGCVPDTARPHGTAQFQFVATNASGGTASATFSIRTDRHAPTIGDGPVDRVDQEAPHALAPFRVTDADSGLAHVTARVDGTPVTATTSDFGVVQLGSAPLGPGVHVVELAATDAVGNVATTERRINVVDTTPPVLERVTPGDGGATSFDLSLRARDAVSGIRASSWSVTVNGGPIAGSGDADAFTATVGSLAPGVHRIEAAVSDLAGNRATAAFTYVASAPADMPKDIADQVAQHVTSQTSQTVTATSAGMGEPGAANGGVGTSNGSLGAWIVRGASTSATFGMPAEVTVFVARSGRAVAGRRVSVQRAGIELATATTGDDGLARIGYTAGVPGAHGVVVEGLDAMALQVHIAPRVLLTASRSAKRGAKVRVAGRLQPALSGHALVLEARSGSGWFVVRRGVKTGRGGTFATTFTANARGRFQLRVRVSARAGWESTTSSPALLTVR